MKQRASPSPKKRNVYEHCGWQKRPMKLGCTTPRKFDDALSDCLPGLAVAGGNFQRLAHVIECHCHQVVRLERKAFGQVRKDLVHWARALVQEQRERNRFLSRTPWEVGHADDAQTCALCRRESTPNSFLFFRECRVCDTEQWTNVRRNRDAQIISRRSFVEFPGLETSEAPPQTGEACVRVDRWSPLSSV